MIDTTIGTMRADKSGTGGSVNNVDGSARERKKRTKNTSRSASSKTKKKRIGTRNETHAVRTTTEQSTRRRGWEIAERDLALQKTSLGEFKSWARVTAFQPIMDILIEAPAPTFGFRYTRHFILISSTKA